ncbi:MAG: hypothetical protein QF632_00470 [Candidatus Woesearchaeota archaeon]|jgi:hypothetical protein|nr:hypothetical protein [Candidatus Woesearchaeota archaeon]
MKHLHSTSKLIVVFAIIIGSLFILDLFPKQERIDISGAASGSIVICINRKPDINSSCNTTATVSVGYNCTVNGSGRDSGQTITFLDNTSLFNISQTGGINFTPINADIGNTSIELRVEDNSSCANNRSINSFFLNISSGCVNTVPTLNLSCNASGSINLNYSCILNVSTEDDDQHLNYSTNTSIFEINLTGGFNFTPVTDDLGEHSILITIADNSTCSNNVTSKVFNLTLERQCGDGGCDTNESTTSCTEDCGTTAAEEAEKKKATESRRRTSRPKKIGKPSVSKPPPKKPLPDTSKGKPPLDKESGLIDTGQLVGAAGNILSRLTGVIKDNLTRPVIWIAVILVIVLIIIIWRMRGKGKEPTFTNIMDEQKAKYKEVVDELNARKEKEMEKIKENK